MSCKKKLLKIRNLSEFPPVSDVCVREKWEILKRNLCLILNSKPIENYLEELFGIVVDLYDYDPHFLMRNVLITIKAYLLYVHKVMTQTEKTNILVIQNIWRQFCQNIITIRNICLPLGQTLQSASYCAFRNTFIMSPIVREKLISDILLIVETERKGLTCEAANLQTLQSIIAMSNKLDVYELVFEMEFLRVSDRFYELEGESLIEKFDMSDYLLHITKRIDEESCRAKIYFNKSTELPLLNLILNQLVQVHVNEILNKGFENFISNEKFKELTVIYDLFKQIPTGCTSLLYHLEQFIDKKGSSIVNSGNDKTIIQDLMDFREYLDKAIMVCFEDDNLFSKSVVNMFRKILASCKNKTARLLAKYADNKLRCKHISDHEFERIALKVMILLRYLQNKDTFGLFYKNYLAKRLILERSISQDAESMMVMKLKEEFGSEFTSSLEGMFLDINLSKSINDLFKQKQNNNTSFSNKFSVYVLTKNHWPNYQSCDVKLPVELINSQMNFQTFYSSNHSGRKLSWQANLGHCLIKCFFDGSIKELQVSPFQALVLLLFNNANKISLKEIQQSTNINLAALRQILLSLSNKKIKILINDSKSREPSEEDTFSFNYKFSNKLFRIRIDEFQESIEDEKEIERSVFFDRQQQIDAAIMRIMKQRKSIDHNNLISELFNVVDKSVKIADLKKRIEFLIEKEYIERDTNNTSFYTYVA